MPARRSATSAARAVPPAPTIAAFALRVADQRREAVDVGVVGDDAAVRSSRACSPRPLRARSRECPRRRDSANANASSLNGAVIESPPARSARRARTARRSRESRTSRRSCTRRRLPARGRGRCGSPASRCAPPDCRRSRRLAPRCNALAIGAVDRQRASSVSCPGAAERVSSRDERQLRSEERREDARVEPALAHPDDVVPRRLERLPAAARCPRGSAASPRASRAAPRICSQQLLDIRHPVVVVMREDDAIAIVRDASRHSTSTRSIPAASAASISTCPPPRFVAMIGFAVAARSALQSTGAVQTLGAHLDRVVVARQRADRVDRRVGRLLVNRDDELHSRKLICEHRKGAVSRGGRGEAREREKRYRTRA